MNNTLIQVLIDIYNGSSSNSKKEKVDHFDLKTMRKHCTVCILGKRAKGKTTLLKKLVRTDNVKIFCNKHEKYENYKDVNTKCDIDNLSIEKIDTVIFDDIFHDKNVTKNINFRSTVMNNRCYKLDTFISCQYPYFPPDIRANFDYVFLLEENNRATKELLYKHYGGIFSTFSQFDETFTELTKKYGVMVINNTSCAHTIKDNIFWY